MDISSLIQLGAAAIQGNKDKNTTPIPFDAISAALGNLLGAKGGKIDLGERLSKMQSGDLADIASSWLGKGPNKPVQPNALAGIFGADRIRAFAAELGLSEESAKNAIADALPEMVNHASPQGWLSESLASGFGKMFDAAKKFL